MRPLPTAPSADDEISASFMRRLIECIKERTILNAPGYRTRSGPNGTTLEIEPVKRSSSPAAVLPWSFSCTEADDPENPGETVRTGGWTNCILQLGYKTFFFSPEFQGRLGYNAIEGTDTCDDGEHYVVVDSIARTARIEVAQSAADAPQDDPANGVVVLRIGTVREAKLTQGLHVNPVIPTYL